jgi:hypothetical protein
MLLDIAPIIGFQIELEDQCKACGSRITAISSGSGPHAAALRCAACNRFNRWLSDIAATALVDGSIAVTKTFGRKPIIKFKVITEHLASLSGADEAELINNRAHQPEKELKLSTTLTEDDMDELYGSPYFNGTDFPKSTTLELTITRVEKKEFRQQDGTTERKAILTFKGNTKALPLNATNYRTLAEE